MAYAAWSVVADEQPTTAKWNILGTNDSSFNDGSGFATGSGSVGIPAAAVKQEAWTDWTPAITGITSATTSGRWQRVGNRAFVNFALSGTGSTTAFTITNWPVTAKTTQDWALGQATDNGVSLTIPARARLTAAGVTLTLFKDMSGAAWTASGPRVAGGNIEHECQ